jgi:predicted nuclease with TOPRIM domain
MNAAARVVDLEEENERLQERLHEFATQLKAAQGQVDRYKASLQQSEGKLRRAQDSERAALAQAASSSFAVEPEASVAHALWEETAQCVVASFRERALVERAYHAELVDMILRFHPRLAMAATIEDALVTELRATNDRYMALARENEKLCAALAGAGAAQSQPHGNTSATGLGRASTQDARAEVVRLQTRLGEAERQAAHYAEQNRKLIHRYRLLEDELATVYRHGIAAKEAQIRNLQPRAAAIDVEGLSRRVHELEHAVSSSRRSASSSRLRHL